MKNCLVIIGFALCLIGCRETERKIPKAGTTKKSFSPIVIPNFIVLSSDTALHLINGVWYYHHQLFSGTMKTFYSSGKLKAIQSFYQGKEESLLTTFYQTGNLDSKRYYHLGEKDSINSGWWENGNPRFEYHFKNGMYEGDFREWYATGKPMKHIVFQDGKEQSGKGWRENGKVYMSFVMRDGRLYGLVNPNLCYSLKNEKGEFRESIPKK